jgi:hypothetical protein
VWKTLLKRNGLAQNCITLIGLTGASLSDFL